MIKLNLYNETKDILRKYNISANKKLGQNFLKDVRIVKRIVDVCSECVKKANMKFGDIDDIIPAEELRARIISALYMLAEKADGMPDRKHGVPTL